jgi:hypothetical protein
MGYQDEGYVVVRFTAPSGATRCVCLHTETAGAAVPGLVADALEVIAGRHGARWYGEVREELPEWSEPHFFAGLLFEPLGHAETCTLQSRIQPEASWRPVLVVDFTTRLVRNYDALLGSLGDVDREGEEELLEHPPEDVVERAAALEVRPLYVGTFAGFLGRLLSTPRGSLTQDVDPLGEWEAVCPRRTSGASVSVSRPRRTMRGTSPSGCPTPCPRRGRSWSCSGRWGRSPDGGPRAASARRGGRRPTAARRRPRPRGRAPPRRAARATTSSGKRRHEEALADRAVHRRRHASQRQRCPLGRGCPSRRALHCRTARTAYLALSAADEARQCTRLASSNRTAHRDRTLTRRVGVAHPARAVFSSSVASL